MPRSSERRPDWVRALAALLCATLAWTPWALAWGDALHDAASAGQAAGEAARGALSWPSVDGAAAVMPGGNLSFGTLFPGAERGSSATFSQVYGNDTLAVLKGQQAQSTLLSESAPHADAYRTLRASVERSRPDMRLDPLWSQTDDVLDNFEAIAETFAHCETLTTFTDSTRQTHVPDYRTCDRLADLTNATCTAVRTFAANSFKHEFQLMLGDQFLFWNQLDTTFDLKTGTASFVASNSLGGSVSGTYNIGFALGANYCATGNPVVSMTNAYANWATWDPLSPTGFGTIAQPMNSWPTLTQVPSCANALVGKVSFNSNQYGPSTCSWFFCGWGWPTPTIELSASATSEDRWTWLGHDCPDILALGGNGFCSVASSCTQNANSDCITYAGQTYCGASLRAPPVAGAGIGRGCTRIASTVDCRGFNRGQMDCWTDAHGNLQCPFNEGDQRDDCVALEQDPACGFIKSTCVEGATDDRGVCFLHEETWDCGSLHAIPVLDRMQSVDCAGPVSCMGSDCVSFPSEQSADFASAAAALGAAQMMITDMQCTPGGACIVFSGTANACKRAVGGIVNCCKTPEGVSLGNYLSLVFALAKTDSAILAMDKGSQVRGAWETLRAPVTSTWSAVQQSFTSVANTLTGETAAAASDVAATGLLEEAKQQLLSATAEWAARTFGDAAVNVLFSTVNGAGAAVTNGSVNGTLQLGGGGAWLGTVMAWAMWAYTIYTVAMILIKLIWTCEQSEFELGAKRELRACHKVGGYCRKSVLGWCIEKRDTYCCFNTPLSRIINEQIRPQLGRGWGSAKHPDCTGINVQALSRVDWSRVNLDEWLAILYETGNFPTAETLNIDELTGSGSLLAGGEVRPNTNQRTVDRTDGLDAEQQRMDAEAQLWSGALTNLPTEAQPEGAP